jgi:hypothetical protein
MESREYMSTLIDVVNLPTNRKNYKTQKTRLKIGETTKRNQNIVDHFATRYEEKTTHNRPKLHSS